ncbi:bacteriohopanetetrol glucosamine biosynthesis glycosyltransferase HpnI [Phormidium sp. CLA17]|uniref:bacteriohopanetetrol glucosamine biosynthesis glycosyltransferase HpnI n=1 Tax=Leptolyngbya sp. Cla-17 TaxID=2803751 RepID=UPI0018D9F366|nr:bacteriohopanetetrol glucosamine biosynthesis glycosyltransferase HpnI [Leptolyngbya sp. Cla-17]MBM0741171.1 bacteriohopanetetrol glucosamine biosynthesis glycosyltransferase HpnI [Leptolyngbya sp. Cla-17]
MTHSQRLILLMVGATSQEVFRYVVLGSLFLLSVSAIAYYGYAIYAASRFFAHSPAYDQDFHPPVSILRPICGVDSKTYGNLASFCQQDYPDYQIIFGVQDPQDPSMDVVRQLIKDFPNLDIQVTTSLHTLGANRKVSNLSHAVTKARYDLLLLADSDVHVQSNYLRRVIQPLSDPAVGVVTCLYRSITQGWVTTLEALSTPTEFLPGVLVSTALEGIKFAMGQTIVIRRSVLEEIGGFAAIADYLADDFQLGFLPTQAGYKVVLSEYLIEHVMPLSTIAESIHRQTRWLVGIRASRPWGYAGLIFTHGTVTSLLFLLATGGSALGWSVLGITWTMRLAMAWFVGIRCLGDPVAQKLFWLVPLRDVISFMLWGYSFIGNTVEWRDRQFRLTRSGKLVALTPNLTEQVKTIAG